MNLEEKKISGEIIYNGKILTLIKDKVLCPNGNTSFREVVLHNGGAAILCITKDNLVYLVKQFRYPYNEVMYEIPAGKLELNENPYDAALREFEEETGNKAKRLIDLGCIYPSCGYTSEKIYLFLANDFTISKQNLDSDETLEVVLMPLDKVEEMVLNGEIKDSKAICALYRYNLLKKNGKI